MVWWHSSSGKPPATRRLGNDSIERGSPINNGYCRSAGIIGTFKLAWGNSSASCAATGGLSTSAAPATSMSCRYGQSTRSPSSARSSGANCSRCIAIGFEVSIASIPCPPISAYIQDQRVSDPSRENTRIPRQDRMHRADSPVELPSKVVMQKQPNLLRHAGTRAGGAGSRRRRGQGCPGPLPERTARDRIHEPSEPENHRAAGIPYRVLLIVTGRTPQVVTETLYALCV
jgi:hypothetical protein